MSALKQDSAEFYSVSRASTKTKQCTVKRKAAKLILIYKGDVTSNTTICGYGTYR